MGRAAKSVLVLGCLAVVLSTATGCTISIQPWTKPVMSGPTGMDPNHGGMMMPGFQGPIPKPLPNMPGGNEAYSQMIQKFTEADDHRKVLLEQVQALKKELRDREGQVSKALYEVEESTTKLKNTRSEFRQWETEMNELRERVRKLEDNRRMLGQMIEEIMNHLDRPREPARNPILDRMK